MSIYQGDTKISGNVMMVALPMFFATYQPRKLNNPSWLRAEPYSWHSADLYVSAYAHLADNISGVTAQTETIAGTTITFYKLSDEIKVVLPDQQTNLDTIYNATGIGYYFVLDTTNRQFKLPRNIYGFTGYRGDVGGYVAESLPNIKGKMDARSNSGLASGAFIRGTSISGSYAGTGGTEETVYAIDFNASRSSSTYQDNAPVQERATQAYLYFYVGNTVQNETLVDVGEMSEAINDKVDLASSWGFPTGQYIDMTLGSSGTTYTAPADGYVAVAKLSTANLQNLTIDSNGWRAFVWANATDINIFTWLPVKKGAAYQVYYNLGGATAYFRFYYAQKTN